MLDCKELAGKESAEKYELNCKRKSKKKKSVGKNAVRQESVGKQANDRKKARENHSAALYRECKVMIPAWKLLWDASHAVKRSQL